MEGRPPWWGHSKEHGWVVLDRDIPCNVPGLRGELMFFRCRDETIYFLKRELWQTPSYQYAPNYARGLPDAAADEARQQIDALMGRWSELRAELQRQHRQAEADRQTKETPPDAAAVVRKPRRAAAPALRPVGADE